MLYLNSFFINAKPLLEQWADAARTNRLEILDRICNYGENGLIFDKLAFRRQSDKTYLGIPSVRGIISLIGSNEPYFVADGWRAYEDLQVSLDAVRDFCRATGTRLPDAALGSDHRSKWLEAREVAPAKRLPTPTELEQAKNLYRKRQDASRAWEQQPRIKVAPAGGLRPRPTPRAAAVSEGGEVGQSAKHRASHPAEAPVIPAAANQGLAHSEDDSQRAAVKPGLGQNPPSPPVGKPLRQMELQADSDLTVKRHRGYAQQDEEIIKEVQELVRRHRVSAWRALEMIPDDRLPGTGTASSRRKRIHNKIPKV